MADRSPRRRVLVVLGVLTAFGPLSIDMYLPGLPALSADLGASATVGQLTLSASLAGLALGQGLVGPVSDAWGRRRPLLIGLGVYAIASTLCAVTPSIGVLIGLRLIQGVAGAAGIVIARAVVRDLSAGAAAARAYAALAVVGGIAPILAPIIGAQILRVGSWRTVFVLLAAVGVSAAIVVAVLLPESLSTDRRNPRGAAVMAAGFQTLLRDRQFIGYACAMGLVTAAMFVYISGSPFVLQNVYGLSEQTFSLVFAINGAGIVAASVIAGRLATRFGTDRVFRWGLITAVSGGALVLVTVLAGAGLAPLLAGLFLVVSSVGIISPTGTALALEPYPHAAGSASALIGTLQFGLGTFAAPVAGIGGSHTALPLACAISVLGISALVVHHATCGSERAQPGPGLSDDMPARRSTNRRN